MAASSAFAQDHKTSARSSKQEDDRYQNDLKKNPNSAEPHWRHANALAAFKVKGSEEAYKYYLKALELDSTNARIWVDYGDYLLAVMESPTDALYMYKQALELEPDNKTLKDKVDRLGTQIEAKRERFRLRNIGQTDKRTIDHGLTYAAITNFDSLKRLTDDKTSRYYYKSLLKRFLDNDPISEWDTYLLCVAYSFGDSYSPYSSASNELYKLNMNERYDEVLAREQEVLAKNPVSGSIYRELMYAHRRKGDEDIADLYQRRAQRLYDAMIFTGDGTCEKPYVTLTASDEYSMIGYVGLYSTGNQSLTDCAGSKADEIMVEDNDGSRSAIHFNVALMFMKMGLK